MKIAQAKHQGTARNFYWTWWSNVGMWVVLQDEMPFLKKVIGCKLASMQDLYAIVKEADKIITFW